MQSETGLEGGHGGVEGGRAVAAALGLARVRAGRAAVLGGGVGAAAKDLGLIRGTVGFVELLGAT